MPSVNSVNAGQANSNSSVNAANAAQTNANSSVADTPAKGSRRMKVRTSQPSVSQGNSKVQENIATAREVSVSESRKIKTNLKLARNVKRDTVSLSLREGSKNTPKPDETYKAPTNVAPSEKNPVVLVSPSGPNSASVGEKPSVIVRPPAEPTRPPAGPGESAASGQPASETTAEEAPGGPKLPTTLLINVSAQPKKETPAPSSGLLDNVKGAGLGNESNLNPGLGLGIGNQALSKPANAQGNGQGNGNGQKKATGTSSKPVHPLGIKPEIQEALETRKAEAEPKGKGISETVSIKFALRNMMFSATAGEPVAGGANRGFAAGNLKMTIRGQESEAPVSEDGQFKASLYHPNSAVATVENTMTLAAKSYKAVLDRLKERTSGEFEKTA